MQTPSGCQTSRRAICLILASVGLVMSAASSGTASASGMLATGTIVTVKATAGTEVGQLSYFLPANTIIGGEYAWSPQSTPVTINSTSGNVVLGTLNSLQLVFDADPQITLAFDVTSANQTTTFEIVSDTLTFSPILNPEAFANASATLVDANNSAWAKLTGKISTPWGIFAAFQARYNGTTSWADLIAPMQLTDAGASIMAEEGRPEPPPSTNREIIPTTVNNIQCKWYFSLTAYDRAYGSGTFNITPEPATAVLLLFGLAIIRRPR